MVELLKVTGLRAGYGRVEVLHGLDLHLNQGEVLAVVGANGAAKSTLINVLSGVVPARQGEILWEGRSIKGMRPAKIARAGLRQVPEGRRVFVDLSVEDNLRMGGYGRSRAEVNESLETIYELFPRLKERRTQLAGSLSGGEQQMVAIGRAVAGKPRLLMLDEPSMGLAPLVVAEIFRLIGVLKNELHMSILIVEQNARAALRLCDRAHVLSLGQSIIEGTGADLMNDPAVQQAFLGGGQV
jgi:branched-chain amino acid transport system ATP-binding protein